MFEIGKQYTDGWGMTHSIAGETEISRDWGLKELKSICLCLVGTIRQELIYQENFQDLFPIRHGKRQKGDSRGGMEILTTLQLVNRTYKQLLCRWQRLIAQLQMAEFYTSRKL